MGCLRWRACCGLALGGLALGGLCGLRTVTLTHIEEAGIEYFPIHGSTLSIGIDSFAKGIFARQNATPYSLQLLAWGNRVLRTDEEAPPRLGNYHL